MSKIWLESQLLRLSSSSPHDESRGHYVKTWRHTQNQNYITYRNTARAGANQGHWQHAEKNLVKLSRLVFELREWIDKQANRNTYHNTSHPSLPRGGGEVTITSVVNYQPVSLPNLVGVGRTTTEINALVLREISTTACVSCRWAHSMGP